MKLYHGSKDNFKSPIFGCGNPSNDYGLGFYMTPDKTAAELWASQYKEGGHVICFNVDLKGLNVLTLDGSAELDVLRWIAILAKHRFPYQERIQHQEALSWLDRHFGISLDGYDMVVGYRADDSYFSYSLGFVSGQISLETLSSAMRLGRLGLQYVAISKKGFHSLRYLGSYPVEPSSGYADMRSKTLGEYHELLVREDRFHNTFIGELMKKYGE